MNHLQEDLTRTMTDPVHMSDDEIERRAREILAEHPPEKDHELDPVFREHVQRVRATIERNDRARAAYKIENKEMIRDDR